MIHYHFTPITPRKELLTLAGCHLGVSFARPDDVRVCHEIAQSVMLDNGAFTIWRQGGEPNWASYYDWCDEWLDCPTTWAVIPDQIDADEETQDQLLKIWPYGQRGAPVWHLNESVSRLLHLTDEHPRICLGSAGEYAQVGSNGWKRKMFIAFNEVSKRHQRLPWLHGLRMQSMSRYFPFGSVDSADIGRNHNRPQNTAAKMAKRWDSQQPRFKWMETPIQQELVQQIETLIDAAQQ